MTRLWPEGDGIKIVLNDEGNPQSFWWQGRSHDIGHIMRRWRVRSDWWREPLWRDYFKLTTETGLLLIIYHDLNQDTWYVQRLFD